MQKIDNLEIYRIVMSVAQTGSAKATGERLGLETTNVFRCLRQIETELGVALFNRDTRPMRLTEKGKAFCAMAEQMLTLQQHLLAQMSEDEDADAGLIRIASTAGIRHDTITPAIVRYYAEHPQVQFELADMVDGNVNFMRSLNGVENDIVLRYASENPLPANVETIALCPIPFYACASPVYIERHGAPTSPADCVHHKGVLLKLAGRELVGHLVRDGVSERLAWASTTRFNSQLDAIDALVLGAGVVPDMALPYFYEVLHAGEAVPVMPHWHRPSTTMCLYVTKEAMKKRRVRYFVEWFSHLYVDEMTRRQHWVDAYLKKEDNRDLVS